MQRHRHIPYELPQFGVHLAMDLAEEEWQHPVVPRDVYNVRLRRVSGRLELAVSNARDCVLVAPIGPVKVLYVCGLALALLVVRARAGRAQGVGVYAACAAEAVALERRVDQVDDG
jgi:hypothetical protein